MAQRAEALGYDSLWFADHLLMKMPEVEPQGAWEAWSVLAALGAVTERIELAPFVTCTGYRNPSLIAKIAETVDEISSGRLILGIGAGWAEPEYRAFGFPFDHRVSRFEEGLRIVHGLLRHGRVDFVGRFHEARQCELQPRGPRPGGPPILIGSIGARMLDLLARYGDLWNAYFSHTKNRPDGVPPLRERVDAACRAAGRDPATVGRTAAEVPLLVGTLGKACGTFGAFVAGDRDVIDLILQRARSYIYTTALPPAVAAATRASLAILRAEGARRAHLAQLINRFRAGAAQRGLPLAASITAIQPILMPGAEQCLAASRMLMERGFWVSAIRHPTVPAGTERLRVTLSAGHREPDVEALLDALAAVLPAARGAA